MRSSKRHEENRQRELRERRRRFAESQKGNAKPQPRAPEPAQPVIEQPKPKHPERQARVDTDTPLITPEKTHTQELLAKHGTKIWWGLSLAMVVAVLYTIANGLPVLDHGFQLAQLFSGLFGLAALGVLRSLLPKPGHTQAIRWGSYAVAIVVAFFTVGTVSVIVVNGEPQPRWSDTAKAWQLSEEVNETIAVLTTADTLVNLEGNDARAAIDEIIAVQEELAILDVEWGARSTDPETFPDPRFADVSLALSLTAADMSAALEQRLLLTSQEDPQARAALDALHLSSLENVSVAARTLREIAVSFDFDLAQLVGNGVVE